MSKTREHWNEPYHDLPPDQVPAHLLDVHEEVIEFGSDLEDLIRLHVDDHSERLF